MMKCQRQKNNCGNGISQYIITLFSKNIAMELIDVMLKRRSTRKFSDEPVTKSELDKILQAADAYLLFMLDSFT